MRLNRTILNIKNILKKNWRVPKLGVVIFCLAVLGFAETKLRAAIAIEMPTAEVTVDGIVVDDQYLECVRAHGAIRWRWGARSRGGPKGVIGACQPALNTGS